LASESWTNDILGCDFEQMTIRQADDYEGKVICTLVRKKALNNTNKAVFYVHGFNDYFFQKEMAEKFNENKFDFYAIDLRKYGRSYLENQKFNNVRDINEYYPDLDKALEQIRNEGHNLVLLSGHSTGGLIVTVYAGDHPESRLFHAVYVNSPNYAFNNNFLLRKIILPLVSGIGKKKPDKLINGGFSPFYGPSLHKDDHGEWEYLLGWKPHVAPLVNFGFVRAIHLAQNKVRHGLKINVPVLIMHSSKSLYEKQWSARMFTGDVILNVRHIRKNARNIQGDVTIQDFDGGMHDLILSPEPVREKVYQNLFEWLRKFDRDMPKENS
jgi:alpha-beta hydrolase superfamily lysophospholipase